MKKMDLIVESRDRAKAEMTAINALKKRGTPLTVKERTNHKLAEAQFLLAEAGIAKEKAAEERSAIRVSELSAIGLTGTNSRSGLSGFYTSGADIYHPQSNVSYFGDMLAATKGDSFAQERLARHNKQATNTLAKSDDPELRAISTTAGTGGEFVPPLWLVNNYIAAVRPARATADILQQMPLPSGTNVMNIPKINTGTQVAYQATQNTGINIQDIVTTSVAAPVYTIAGGETFSTQLFEQSPIAGQVDKVILADLMADYARQIGTTVLNGTGTGQVTGLLNVAGTNSITYTDATPTFMGVSKLYSKIGQAVQAIQTARYAAPTAIVMHPRRWAWIAVQVDSSNRAVVLPDDLGPLNASGAYSNQNPQGVVGRMFGLPCITDPNIPINTGAGTNQDPIIILKADDTILWESTLRTELFPQTYANQLTILARVYNYVAMATRIGSSISIINGTGLSTPSF